MTKSMAMVFTSNDLLVETGLMFHVSVPLSACHLIGNHVVVLSIGHPARSVLQLRTSSLGYPQTAWSLRLMVTVQSLKPCFTLAAVLLTKWMCSGRSSYSHTRSYEVRHLVIMKLLCGLHFLHTCGDELTGPLNWKQCKEIVLQMAKRLEVIPHGK